MHELRMQTWKVQPQSEQTTVDRSHSIYDTRHMLYILALHEVALSFKSKLCQAAQGHVGYEIRDPDLSVGSFMYHSACLWCSSSCLSHPAP